MNIFFCFVLFGFVILKNNHFYPKIGYIMVRMESMYKTMWENTGISYTELIDELLTLALERPLGLR